MGLFRGLAYFDVYIVSNGELNSLNEIYVLRRYNQINESRVDVPGPARHIGSPQPAALRRRCMLNKAQC